MTEELRDVLLERFASVYSGYGATDIEIGMAGESPVSIAVRRLARARPDIRLALFGTDARLPMVFQYNPLIHYLEVNDQGEVVCTVSRLDLLAPRIRYNVHDAGGIVPFDTVRKILAGFGYDLDRLGAAPELAGPRGPLPWTRPIPLPFVWIHGRRDATISVMGSNIYPEDVEAILYRDPAVEPRLHSFMVSVVDDDAGTPRPAVALELTDLDGVDAGWLTRRRRTAARRSSRPQHRLSGVAQGVPGRDAADRDRLPARRRTVRRRREPDQAASSRLRRHGRRYSRRRLRKRGLDPLLEGRLDADVGERGPRRLARLRQRVAERLERRDDLALARRAARHGRSRDGHAGRRHLLAQLEDDPLGELLADTRDGDEDGLVLGHDRELEVGRRARSDDREGDLRPDAVDRQQQREEPELLDRPEAVQRLEVLADEVVGVELQPPCPAVRRRGRPAPRTRGSRSRRPR